MTITEDPELLIERRLAEIARPYIDSRVGIFTDKEYTGGGDRAEVIIAVTQGAQLAPNFGYYSWSISVDYEPRANIPKDVAGEVWGQIMMAFGDGFDGASPLHERFDEGQVKLIGGVESVIYDSDTSYSPDEAGEVRTFEFEIVAGTFNAV